MDQNDEGILELEPETMTSLDKETGTDVPSTFHVKVFDGAALMHILLPRNTKTYEDYANDVFLHHIRQQTEGAMRVDVVWDKYRTQSIK